MRWPLVALGYLSYLALASLARPAFRRSRAPLFAVAAAAWAAYALAPRLTEADWAPPVVVVVVAPALVLLGGYWLSGLLFVDPDPRVERWLLRVDRAVLTRPVLAWLNRAPRVVAEYFELSYLLVYLVVPAGAVTLVAFGRGDDIDHYWTVVLLAEFACYGMLPWIQTRPPRVLEADCGGWSHNLLVRRLNLAIANRASIHANTLPSGHAAGALVTALAVSSLIPSAGVGAVFLILAVSIAVSTVIGRYHYAIDSALGILVAAAVWILV